MRQVLACTPAECPGSSRRRTRVPAIGSGPAAGAGRRERHRRRQFGKGGCQAWLPFDLTAPYGCTMNQLYATAITNRNPAELAHLVIVAPEFYLRRGSA